MSPVAGDDAPMTESESKAACIGIILGVLLSFGGCGTLIHIAKQPASAASIAEFNAVFETTITPWQTRIDFKTEDPTTHQLQQNLVDRKLWSLVATAYEKGREIEQLQKQRQLLLSTVPSADNPVESIKNTITAIDGRIANGEKERGQIADMWTKGRHLAVVCGFTDSGADTLDTALYKYSEWLKQQRPPRNTGTALLIVPLLTFRRSCDNL